LSKIGFENVHGYTQNGRNNFGYDLLERYHKNGDEFLNHIVRVTGGENRVSFLNVENKEQSKQCVNTHSPKKSNEFEQTSVGS
jgi:hypothetical protein